MDLSYSDPQGLSLNTELTVNDMRVSAEHSRYSKFLFRCNYSQLSRKRTPSGIEKRVR